MILVDSSVLISDSNRQLMSEAIDAKSIAVCGPVVYEVLRGASDGRLEATRRTLFRLLLLDDPTPAERYEEAARLYRMLRVRGITIRSMLDCVIAAIAIHHSVPLLHADRDFTMIARYAPLDERNVSSLVS
jgi:predicted nucleic acid-binding protein